MSYMVSIEGSNAPTVIHPTYASAQLEAERLATQPRNRDRTIHVLKLVSSFKPVTKHYWEHREEPLSITGKAFDAELVRAAIEKAGSEADARAEPDLLGALMNLEAMVERCRLDGEPMSYAQTAARNVIAKATGEQP